MFFGAILFFTVLGWIFSLHFLLIALQEFSQFHLKFGVAFIPSKILEDAKYGCIIIFDQFPDDQLVVVGYF